MRRMVTAVSASCMVTLLVFGALVGLAPGAGAAAIPGTDCATTTYRILFWPKGHKAVPSVGFPAFATPHVEVYSGTGKKFLDAQQVGYEDATTEKISTTAPCVASSWNPGPKGNMKKVTTKPRQLVCKFSASPVLFGAKVTQGGYTIGFYVHDKPSAYVSIGPSSALQWDAKQCKAKKLPH
jgi:hypothetical protein